LAKLLCPRISGGWHNKFPFSREKGWRIRIDTSLLGNNVNRNQWTATIERYLAEGRTVSGAKGDSTAKAGEKSQLAFTQQLQQAFSTQFASNRGVLNFLNGKLTDAVNNPQGMSPEALAAARTNATQTTAQDYAHASQAVNGQIAARGGSTLPSGVTAQIEGGLAQGAANENSSQQNDITLQNEQMRQQNYWKAVGGLNGVAEEYNPTGFASSTDSAAGTVAGLSEANTQASNSGWFNQFMGGLGGGLGKGLGAGLSTGFKKE
jgi:hypothetical protein